MCVRVCVCVCVCVCVWVGVFTHVFVRALICEPECGLDIPALCGEQGQCRRAQCANQERR